LWDVVLGSVDADIVVVPGGLADIEAGVERLSKIDRPVVYVPGVEECRSRELTEVADVGRNAARDTTVHVLSQNAVVLDGVRFLGATLWTSSANPSIDSQEWFKETSDELNNVLSAKWWADSANAEYASALCVAYDWTYPGEKHSKMPQSFHPVVCHVENQRALAWLSTELAKDFAGPTAIVSHFEPGPFTCHGSMGLKDASPVGLC
jgi:hypothetical protein